MTAAIDMLDISLEEPELDRVRVHRPFDLERRRRRDVRAATEPMPARVLVAEDDSAMRAMLVESLREAGYQVIEVANGRQLETCLDPQGKACPMPDIIVSDVRMPGRTGLEVLARLREIDWAMPVIIITAFGDRATHEEAYRLGAAQVIDKPFDVDDMVDAVRAIVPPTL